MTFPVPDFTRGPGFGVIDTHAHLDQQYFGDQQATVLQRAFDAGVGGILLMAAAGQRDIFAQTLQLAATDPRLLAAGGVHPHSASDYQALEAELRAHLKDFVALGEIGLDYHYDFSPRAVQVDVFSRQLDLALEAGLPVILHLREAWDEGLAILDQHQASWRGIVHCYTQGPQLAQEFLRRGFLISLPGVLTFPRSVEAQETARTVPLDRLLVETDSPYLAPVPFRGKQNEPALVVHTLHYLSRLLDRRPDEITRILFRNFNSLLFPAAIL
jgi:TatD DNase family protein